MVKNIGPVRLAKWKNPFGAGSRGWAVTYWGKFMLSIEVHFEHGRER